MNSAAPRVSVLQHGKAIDQNGRASDAVLSGSIAGDELNSMPLSVRMPNSIPMSVRRWTAFKCRRARSA
jgi:hypothetical protein